MVVLLGNLMSWFNKKIIESWIKILHMTLFYISVSLLQFFLNCHRNSQIFMTILHKFASNLPKNYQISME